jgi:hypothetical protein
MKKYNLKLIILLFLTFNSLSLLGQVINQNININFLGGQSGISINYERVFYFNDLILLSAQLGGGVNCEFTLNGCGKKFATMPIQFSTMFGQKNIYLEIGAKGTSLFNEANYDFHFTPIVGIRLQPHKKNSLITRVYYLLSEVNSSNEVHTFNSRIGISLGVIF